MRLVVLTLTLLTVATPAAAKTVEEIQDCIEGNAPELSASQTVLMRTVDRAGEASETRARILWRRPEGERARLLLRVIDPATRRGSALLAIQRAEKKADFYLYLPELRKSRKVSKQSLKGSMFGTDLSYEDFQRVQKMEEDSSVSVGEDSEYDGRKVWTLIATPDEGSAYEKVVTLVDQERCVVLRSEYFESGETPRKIITSAPDQITEESFGWLPRKVKVEDAEEKTFTEIIIEEFDAETEISEKDLSVEKLGKAR